MSSNNTPSSPIPIGGMQRNRGRSTSVSSASTGSFTSNSDLQTPPSSATAQRISIPSPSTSPILSYFLGQSPTAKTPAAATTFPLRRPFGTVPVFENDEEAREIPVATHARRASVTVANRFANQSQPAPIPEAKHDRASGLLRRLSLSTTAYTKPQLDSLRTAGAAPSPPSPPPNSAVNPVPHNTPYTNKPRRSATMSSDMPRPRRAPSPMGERILKGQFDGFN